jgi:hypothetical protein
VTVRRGRSAVVLASAGVLWGVGLTVVAFTIDVSTSERLGPGGVVIRETYTIVHGTGLSGALLALAPAVGALILWVALHAVCARGSDVAATVASVGIALAFVISILGMLSIGWFILPMAVLFAAAARRAPVPAA